MGQDAFSRVIGPFYRVRARKGNASESQAGCSMGPGTDRPRSASRPISRCMNSFIWRRIAMENTIISETASIKVSSPCRHRQARIGAEIRNIKLSGDLPEHRAKCAMEAGATKCRARRGTLDLKAAIRAKWREWHISSLVRLSIERPLISGRRAVLSRASLSRSRSAITFRMTPSSLDYANFNTKHPRLNPMEPK